MSMLIYIIEHRSEGQLGLPLSSIKARNFNFTTSFQSGSALAVT